MNMLYHSGICFRVRISLCVYVWFISYHFTNIWEFPVFVMMATLNVLTCLTKYFLQYLGVNYWEFSWQYVNWFWIWKPPFKQTSLFFDNFIHVYNASGSSLSPPCPTQFPSHHHQPPFCSTNLFLIVMIFWFENRTKYASSFVVLGSSVKTAREDT